jgi:hypothetical protein
MIAAPGLPESSARSISKRVHLHHADPLSIDFAELAGPLVESIGHLAPGRTLLDEDRPASISEWRVSPPVC